MAVFLPANRQSLYCRIHVPLVLRGFFSGRTEVWRSLRTTDREQAQVRAAQIESHAKRVFYTLRKHGHLMDQDTIDRIVAQWLETAIEETEKEWFLGGPISDEEYDDRYEKLDSYCDFMGEALRGGELQRMAGHADELLKVAGLPALDHDSIEFKKLCRRLLEAQLEYSTRLRGRLNGEYQPFNGLTRGGYYSTALSPSASEGLPPSPSEGSPSTKLFSEVVDLYYEENKPRSKRSHLQTRAELQRFLETIGGDRPIGRITKDDCRGYKDHLRNVRHVSLVTQRKRLGTVSSIFKWAGRQGYTPDTFKNPVDGLPPNKKRAQEESKAHRDYTDEELLKVFGSIHFIKQKEKRPDRYWLVLICLFTMCRREEAGQLLLHDICEAPTPDGKSIHYFNFTDEGEDQQLKNRDSRRKVPVHSSLVKLGFMDYVQSLRAKGERRLFPTLTKGKNTFADAAGKWYSRLLKKVGLTDKTLVLHGLRHTGITRLANEGVNDKVRRTLVGHAGQDVHDRIYNHGVPLPMLRDGLEQLRYPEVLKRLSGSSSNEEHSSMVA